MENMRSSKKLSMFVSLVLQLTGHYLGRGETLHSFTTKDKYLNSFLTNTLKRKRKKERKE